MTASRLRWIVVAGPTASGKSDLGVLLAERLGGEILNADSRQIYRHMDIGTAKPSLEERRRVPHHLFDLVDPDEDFDVARYRDLGRAAVEEVGARGRVPVVVGGTGLYVRALEKGLFHGPGAIPALRAVLTRLDIARPGTLARWCAVLDPESAARLHPHDRIRLIRALEVALATGERLSSHQARHRFGEPLGVCRTFVLDPGREELVRRIERRSKVMFDRGLVGELRSLSARGYGPELRVMRSIGYREAAKVLRGEWTTEQANRELARSTWQFARRQLAWFRSERHAVWRHPVRDRARILEEAEAFLFVL